MRGTTVQQAYSGLSDVYIDLFASGDHEHPDDLALIDRHLGSLSGPLLDLGCGPGHLTAHLQSRGRDVTGLDLVPEFVAHARRVHPTARFETGSLTELPWSDGSVAGALSWYSLIHFRPDQLDVALAEIRRVLAPEGVLVVGFFEGGRCEPFAHKVVTAYRWPVDEMSSRLAAAGFREVERIQRPQDGDRRPHGALAAVAT